MSRRIARSVAHFERRAASIASRHVKPEAVDGALKSLARHMEANIADLNTLDPAALDNDLLDAQMRFHAGNHPRRAADVPTAPPAPAPLESGIRRNPTEQLAHRQDQAIAARGGIEGK